MRRGLSQRTQRKAFNRKGRKELPQRTQRKPSLGVPSGEFRLHPIICSYGNEGASYRGNLPENLKTQRCAEDFCRERREKLSTAKGAKNRHKGRKEELRRTRRNSPH